MKEGFQDIGEVAGEIYTSTIHIPFEVALRRGNILSDYYAQISQQENSRAGNYFEVHRETGEITIFDTNNQPINRILPPGMTILNVPGASRYSASDRRVEVDSETLINSGEYGKAMIAHEIGHAFDEENMERYAAKAREYKEQEPKAQPRQKIGMWNDYFIAKDIKQSLRRFVPFASDRKYALLNPLTQQIEQFTFKELEAIRNQASLDRKKADEEFNRKLIRRGIKFPINSIIEQRHNSATVIKSSTDFPADSKWRNT